MKLVISRQSKTIQTQTAWLTGPSVAMPHTLLLHNAKATHGFQRFTHPKERIMCAVHIGAGTSVGGSLKQLRPKAQDKAEEELQDEAETFSSLCRRSEPWAAVLNGCCCCCSIIIITPCFSTHVLLTCDNSREVSSPILSSSLLSLCEFCM